MSRRPTFCFGSLVLASLIACSSDDHSDDIDRLNDRVAELQAATDSLQAQLDGAMSAAAASTDTITNLQHMLDETRAALADALAQLDAPDPDMSELEVQLAELRGQLAAAQTVLNGLAGTLTLELPFQYGGSSLELDHPYPLTAGGTVSFSEMRYWLSNIELVRSDGGITAVPDSYFLVDVRKAQTLTNGTASSEVLPARRRESITVYNVPAGSYRAVRFHVGVDAVHNDDLSLAAGELHVLQNMTADNGWMWFTSYIFTKTAGSTSSGGVTRDLRWDNGSNADYRSVELAEFASPVTLSAAHPVKVRARAEVSALVDRVSPVTNPAIGASSPTLRAALADGFRDMFSLDTVTESAP